jgi:hypothetical protein
MTQAQQPVAPVHIEEETVRLMQHRQSITKRMTRKQTEIRLDALDAMAPATPSPVSVPSEV